MIEFVTLHRKTLPKTQNFARQAFDLTGVLCYNSMIKWVNGCLYPYRFGREENSVVILGIDPGLAIVGWGVIDFTNSRFRTVAYGSIQNPAGMETPQRLLAIYRELKAIIQKYKPEQMAIEELFFTKNITTGIRVAEARGIVLMVGEEMGLKMSEYTPMQVKQAVVGYGLAEKQQVIQLVTMILNLPAPPKPDDTADALAIAMCHFYQLTNPLTSTQAATSWEKFIAANPDRIKP